MRERAERFAQAAAPALAAAAGALSPVLTLFASQLKTTFERAAKAIDVFAATLGPKRHRPARKPCAWCVDSRKRPATHTVKWREPVMWRDELDGTYTMWPAGRVMRMCQFHANIAERYNGVQAYRFRRLE